MSSIFKKCLLLVTILELSGIIKHVIGIEREYFMAVEEVHWDYTPTGANLQNTNAQDVADKFIKQDAHRIGSGYTKVIFKHYADSSYTWSWPQPAYMQLVGPIIRGEVGDVLNIRFKNMADRPYSMFSHGVSYLKNSEGALYVDGTSGSDKYDDVVMPGIVHNYTWLITEENSPTASDPACIPWIYRSNINSPRDTNSGLMGVLLTCKKGTLSWQDHTRKDVSTELVVFTKAIDENQSWYMDSNLNNCGNTPVCETLRDTGEVDWLKSNIMRSVNGRTFSNLPGLSACSGDKVVWYFLTLGNEMDSNTMFVEGQVMDIDNERTSTASVFSGMASTGYMIPRNPGKYRVSSMSEDHFNDGLSAYFTVKNCLFLNGTFPVPTLTTSRNYYLDIEEYDWNYGPSGVDKLSNKMLTDPGTNPFVFFDKTMFSGLGGQYRKVKYVQYTDDSYGQIVGRTPQEEHMGLIGPVIRVEEGEMVNLLLRNKGTHVYSFVGQNLYYKSSDSGYAGGSFRGVVYPGQTHKYTYQVPEDVVQTHDPDCVVRLYYSANNFAADVNSGLIGPLLICRRGTLNANNTPIKNTKEFFLLFKNFDESKSNLFDTSIDAHSDPSAVDKTNTLFSLSNMRQSINGYSYANIPMLNMCAKEEAILYMMALGNSQDDISIHFQGNTLSDQNRNRDTIGFISGMTKTVRMVPDNIGTWAILSMVKEQYLMGMTGRYTVTECGVQTASNTNAASGAPLVAPVSPGVLRRFAIAAVEVDWDYAAKERDLLTGVDLNDPRSDGNVYIRNDVNFIGDVYKKIIYRGYADIGFEIPIDRRFDADHLGILGPVIKAEVGDTIEVIFKNMVNTSRSFSLEPQGLSFDKNNEGYFYEDGQRINDLTGVAFQQTKTYRWTVPARSGPGIAESSCISWLYYSTIDRVRDLESGLIGPIQICKKNTLDSHGRRKDADREFHVMFKKFNENLSWMFDDNVEKLAPGRLGTRFDLDENFEESNKMHSINGESFGNIPGLIMIQNERIIWNIHAIGDTTGFNTVNFHGNTFTRTSKNNHRDDTLEIYPGVSESVVMIARNPGQWLLQSDISDHMVKGMVGVYSVLPKQSP